MTDRSGAAELLEAAHVAISQGDWGEARLLHAAAQEVYFANRPRYDADRQFQIEAELERIGALLLGKGGTAEERAQSCRRLADLCVRWRAHRPTTDRGVQLQARALNSLGYRLTILGGAENLRDAIQAYDEAIGLHRRLDLDVPGYRNDLANSFDNKGGTLSALGGADNLGNAIQAYDNAIDLRRKLELGVPEYRDGLASSFSNKGNAHYDLGGADNLRDAIQAYDAAIDMRRQLDLSVPSYRYDLASCLGNKGNALYALGGARNLSDAILTYEEAIGLLRRLDLDVPEHRNALARILDNTGVALYALASEENLRDAIRAHDAAIDLRRQLDLDVPEYRNALARSLDNKGDALYALGGGDNLRDAVLAYDEVIDLRRQLDLDVPAYRDALARSLGNKGDALYALGGGDNLRDVVLAYDEAIDLRRQLDLDVPAYRNALARSLDNKGYVLYALGNGDYQRDAVLAYDEATALRRQLDLRAPEHRNALARSLDNKGAALYSLGGAENLRDAVLAHDEAIDLRRQLDLDVPEYRKALASSLGNKGDALYALGGGDNLRDAILSYDEAVDLRRQLDLRAPEHRNALARSLDNKGNALYSLGGAENLRDAVLAHDEAIDLLRQLDLDMPEYRDNLAASLGNKGIALCALGGADNLGDAIRAYDEAVGLRRQLNLDVPRNRNALASCFSNKGMALSTLGGAENLKDAVRAHDEAIDLRRQLDLDMPEYRNDLARSLGCKGEALRALGGADNLRDAVRAQDEAIDLGRVFDLGVPKYRNYLASSLTAKGIALNLLRDELPSVAALREAWLLRMPLLAEGPDFHPEAAREGRVTAYWLMRTLASTGQSDEATDVGDAALDIERYLYQRGWSNSDERTTLFDTTLSIYRDAGLGHILPELVAEQLRPESPGSAWDSMPMHDISARHLDAAIGEAIARGRPDRLGGLIQARAELVGLTARNFAGTADSARLRAAAAESRDQPREARAILDDYVALRPLDPQGYLVRARHRHRHGDKAGALQDYDQAALRIVQGAPAPTPEAFEALGEVAEARMSIELDGALSGAAASDTATLQETVFDPLHRRLERLRESMLAQVAGRRGEWEQPLAELMVNRPWQQVVRRRREVVAQHDRQKRAEVIAIVRREIADRLDEISAVACRALPRPWADFVQHILAAVKELVALAPSESSSLELHLHHAVRRAMDGLADEAVAAGHARLAEALTPDEFVTLDPAERRYLAAALIAATHPDIAEFVALKVGCAVEYSLRRRLFSPFQFAWKETGKPLPPPRDASRFGSLHQHLATRNGVVMLGPLVGALSEAMKQIDGSFDDDLIGAVARHLARRPGSPLLGVPEELRQQRESKLGYVLKQRNAASHPGGTPEAAQKVLDAALLVPVVAFFRYFPAAAPMPAD